MRGLGPASGWFFRPRGPGLGSWGVGGSREPVRAVHSRARASLALFLSAHGATAHASTTTAVAAAGLRDL